MIETGLRDRTGEVVAGEPVPKSATVSDGLPVMGIVNAPVRAPTADGENWILNVQPAPEAREVSQVVFPINPEE